MNNIRNFIDLVESFNHANAQQSTFGKKQVDDAPVTADDEKTIADCKKYRSAEAYADAFNSYYPVNPAAREDVWARAEAEQKQLVATWNRHKKAGRI